MISYFNRNNRHAYNRSMFIFSIGSSNSSSFITEAMTCPSILSGRVFNHSNTSFNFNLLRGYRCSSITLMNHSWSFSMILYSNRERWFLNISSRNNRINIISDSLFFNFYRCNYFYFNQRIIFKPLLLREINMSSKRFTKRSYYLRVMSIFRPYLVQLLSMDSAAAQHNLNQRVKPAEFDSRNSLPKSEPKAEAA